MNRLAIFLIPLAALAFGGCIVETRNATYEECDFESDCRVADHCQPYASSTVQTNICTRSCRDNLDCPLTATGLEPLCASLDGAPFLCFESCRSNADCAAGFACESLDSGDFICVPR